MIMIVHTSDNSSVSLGPSPFSPLTANETKIQFARIASLLRSFAVSSCSCCIDLSFKMKRDPLRADWSSGKSGKSGTHYNSVQREQIMP